MNKFQKEVKRRHNEDMIYLSGYNQGKEDEKKKTRGYCGIGIENSKFEINLGTLWRSAYCFGADFIFTIGRRYTPQASDTTKAHRHIPYYHYDTIDDFIGHLPYDCKLIGIENPDDAQYLKTFQHPERAIYLLGAEDVGLSEEIMKLCARIVKIDSRICLNVATTGSIVLYDRMAKM